MSIKRYGFDYRGDTCESENGRWVEYEDHAAEVAALRERCEKEAANYYRACMQIAEEIAMAAKANARADRLAEEVRERRLLEFLRREAADDGPAMSDAHLAVRRSKAAVDAHRDLDGGSA